MPEEGKNTLKYSPGDKPLKAPFIVDADLECLLKKKNLVKIILKILTQRKKTLQTFRLLTEFNSFV